MASTCLTSGPPAPAITASRPRGCRGFGSRRASDCKPGVLLLGPGAYCISATMLQQAYAYFPHRWNLSYEQTYHELRSNLKAYDATASDAEARKKLVAELGGQDAWARRCEMFEHVRFARLCNFLRQREPDAEINDSILIYRLSAADVFRALDGPAKMGE